MGKALIPKRPIQSGVAEMHQQVGVRVALFIIALASLACAQAAPSNLEIPTGDVWPSKEELIPLPPQGPADDWEVPSRNLSGCPNAMTCRTMSSAPSERKSSKSVSARRASIRFGKHRYHAHVTGAVGGRPCSRHCLNPKVRRAHCAVDVWRPDSHIGAWCL